MSYIEGQMNCNPTGLHLELDDGLDCDKFIGEFLTAYTYVNEEWSMRHGRALEVAINADFYHRHSYFDLTKNDAGTDISKLTYFLKMAEKDNEFLAGDKLDTIIGHIERFNTEQVAINSEYATIPIDASDESVAMLVSLDKRKSAITSKLGDTALYLEGQAKQRHAQEMATIVESVNAEFGDDFSATQSLIYQFKDSMVSLIKQLYINEFPPNRLDLFYENRPLSMSRDFGRGLGLDGDKYPEAMYLHFHEKHRLLSLCTPSVYISRLDVDGQYTLRCADHAYVAPSEDYAFENYAPKIQPVYELLVDKGGEFNAAQTKDVCQSIKISDKGLVLG